jgi:hypothetical protein
MDCERFDTFVQDLLDRRAPLRLSWEAWRHQDECSDCAGNFQFYRQLVDLWDESAASQPNREAPVDWAHQASDGPANAQPESAAGQADAAKVCRPAAFQTTGIQDTGIQETDIQDTGASDLTPIALPPFAQPPLAQLARPGDFCSSSSRPRAGAAGLWRPKSAGRWAAVSMLTVASAAAVMGLMSNGWIGWLEPPVRIAEKDPAKAASPPDGAPFMEMAADSQNDLTTEIGSHVAGGPVATSRLGDATSVVGHAALRDSMLDPDSDEAVESMGEMRELTRQWDESVVAFDQGWRQMAMGRVRAHQLPGIQPAVYPITGAVEAFRRNLIVRTDNGAAAGLRW